MTALLTAQEITIAIGGKTICEKLSFAIHAGEIWGLLGANGSGKTTLLHALARLSTVAHGKILLEGCPIQQFSPIDLAQRIGILFQDSNANFPQNVWEYCLGARYPHLGYFKRESAHDRELTRTALQCMELENHLKKNIQQLSGGERRRLQVAALLTQSPMMYLLDEPTNHLDLRHQLKVLNTVRSIVKKPTTAALMTLHDINLAQQYCTHLLMLLPEGRFLQGPAAQLLTAPSLSLLYQCQIKQVMHGEEIFWTSCV